jgi:hypothetical protein
MAKKSRQLLYKACRRGPAVSKINSTEPEEIITRAGRLA